MSASNVGNIYLKWLDSNTAPPRVYSREAMLSAFAALSADNAKAIAALQEPSAAVDSAIMASLCQMKQETLKRWLDFQSGSQTPAEKKFIQTTLSRVTSRFSKCNAAAASSGVTAKLMAWKRRRKNPLSDAHLIHVNSLLLGLTTDAATKPTREKAALRLLFKKHNLQTEARSRQHTLNPVVLTSAMLKEVPETTAKRCRAKGMSVMPTSEDADLFLQLSSDRALRREIYTKRFAQNTSKHITAILKTRAAMAVRDGDRTFAKKQFSEYGCIIQKPESIRASIDRALTRQSKKHDALIGGMLAIAKQEGFDEINPWDVSYLIRKYTHGYQSKFYRPFKIKAVLPELVKDLAAITGWTMKKCQAYKDNGKQVYQVTLTHPTKPTADLFLSPSAYSESAEDGNPLGGTALTIRYSTKVAGLPTRSVATVECSILKNEKFINQDDVRYFAHELGHIFHDLNKSLDSPDHENEFPQDLIELPSQLMQQYASDPTVLARYSDLSGNPQFNRRFWVNYLDRTAENNFYSVLDSAYASWLELSINSQRHKNVKDFNELHALGMKKFRLASHYKSQRDFQYDFAWSEEMPTFGVYYIIATQLASNLLRGHGSWKPGQDLATRTAKAYRDLTDNVLSQANDGKKVKQAWQRWKGKTMHSAITTAMDKPLVPIF